MCFSEVFKFYLLFFEGRSKESQRTRKKSSRREKAEGRANRANPAASSEQCSRACRDKRTARRAIRRELSEQMSSRGANVKSKACQLARKAGATSNSRYQRAEIVNSAWGRTINLKSGVKTKATTGSSKTRALTKSVPFRVLYYDRSL